MKNLKQYEEYIYMGNNPTRDTRNFVEIIFKKHGPQIYASTHDGIHYKFDNDEDAQKFINSIKEKGEYMGRKVYNIKTITEKDYNRIKKIREEQN